MGSWVEESWQGGSQGPRPTKRWLVEQVVPNSCADEQGGTSGDQERVCNPGFQCRKIKPQNLSLKKPVRVVVVEYTPSLTGEFIGEIHRVLKCKQNHPLWNQHQKGPICLWVSEEVTQSWPSAEQAALLPLRPLPHIQHHNTMI